MKPCKLPPYPRYMSLRGSARSTVSLIAIAIATLPGITGAHAQAVSVTNGTTVSVPGPSFPASTYTTTAAGMPGVGFYAANASTINGNNVTITTNGDLAYGIWADSGGSAIVMNGGSITTTATTGSGIDSAYGARSSGSGRLELHGTSISTAGDSAYGVAGFFSNNILLDGVSIFTTGVRGSGVFIVAGTGVQVTNGSRIEVLGDSAAGIVAALSTVTVADSTVITRGSNGAGLFASAQASGTPGFITATNTTVETFGNGSTGALAFQSGSVLTLDGGTVTTHGSGAAGVSASDFAELTATNTIISTTGDASAGAFAFSSSPGSLIGTINLDHAQVSTSGIGSVGLDAQGNGIVNSAFTPVATTGALAHGLRALEGGTVNFSDQTVTTASADAAGLNFGFTAPGAVNTINVARATIDPAGDGLFVDTGNNVATLTGSTLNAGSGIALNSQLQATTNFLADSSTINGSAQTASSAIMNVTMQNNTLWNMTASSNVTSLVNNNSLLDYAAPAGDPTQQASYKTMTTVNYTGGGERIALNTYLGDDSAPSDRLVINGGTATGTTSLIIRNTGGPGAQTLADGILVVDAQNGATTETTAFSLANRVAAGAYDYNLFRGGASDAESWFLRTTLIPAPQDPRNDGPPDFRNEVPVDIVLPALANRLGLGTLGTYHDRAGTDYPEPAEYVWCKDPSKNYRCAPSAEQSAVYADAVAPRRHAVWGRVFGETGSVEFDSDSPEGAVRDIVDHGPSYDYDMYGLQAGIDLLRRLNGDGSRDIAGLYAAAGRIDADVDAVLDGSAGDSSVDGYSFGGYWTRIGETGWYLDAVLQGTWYDAEGDAKGRAPFAGENFDTEGWGFDASLEGGYPFALGNGWSVEPQAQLIYQYVSLDDGADAFGRIDYEATDTLYGRLGARLTKDWLTQGGQRMTAWGRANVWSGFGAESSATFSNPAGDDPVDFDTDIGGTWGSVGLGLQSEVGENVAMFATGDYNFRLSSGDFDSWSGRIGIKVKW